MYVRRCLSLFHKRQAPLSKSNVNLVRKKVTIQELSNLRQSKIPITMLAAYDYPTALACSSSPLTDIVLVGDSLAQICLGHSSTTQLTLSEIIHHAKAVAKGTSHPLLLGDMPFGTYYTSVDTAVSNAVHLIKEGGVEGVKMEGGREIADIVRRLTEVGIPVMAHVGLLPQRHTSLSGYKVQGKTVDGAKKLMADALALQDAGAFALLIEAVPLELGKYITERLKIPTIGVGAGPHTSGQVCLHLFLFSEKEKLILSDKALVCDDVMGGSEHTAKFVRSFANLREVRVNAIQSFGEAIRNGSFPDPVNESYKTEKTEWARFLSSETWEDNDTQ